MFTFATLFDQVAEPDTEPRTHRLHQARTWAARRCRSGANDWSEFDSLVEKFMNRKRRQRTYICDHLYVRRVKGAKFQARVWVGDLGSINLGLYDNEVAAWHVVKAWIKAGSHPCRGLPEGILPKYVFRWQDGTGRRFGSRVKMRGRQIALGPFDRPEEAHEAMVRRIKKLFRVVPRPKPQPQPKPHRQPALRKGW